MPHHFAHASQPDRIASVGCRTQADQVLDRFTDRNVDIDAEQHSGRTEITRFADLANR